MGCVAQVNASTVLGASGRGLARLAAKLLDRGLVQIIASDGHGAEARRPDLGRVAAALAKKQPAERVALWLWENAARILEDKTAGALENRAMRTGTEESQVKLRAAIVLILVLGAALAAARAQAQFQQYVPPGEFEEERETMQERLDRATKESRWRVGRFFVDPWLGAAQRRLCRQRPGHVGHRTRSPTSPPPWAPASGSTGRSAPR